MKDAGADEVAFYVMDKAGSNFQLSQGCPDATHHHGVVVLQRALQQVTLRKMENALMKVAALCRDEDQ